jgi:hypothetical protein
VQDVKKAISAAPDQQRSVERKPVASEHERKSALARRIASIARLKELEVPDNAEEKLAIYVDERMHPTTVRRAMERAEVKPAFNPHKIGGWIYRREDVPASL